MKQEICDKMIIAIMQGNEYRSAIDDLNERGFYVTILNSTGGFLKKQNVTIMIGLNHADLDDALEIIRHYGKRTELRCPPNTMGSPGLHPIAPMPIPMLCGGIVVFILDVAGYERA